MTEKEKVLALFGPKEISPKFVDLVEQYFDHEIPMCEGFELYGDQNEALQYFLPEAKRNSHKGQFVVIGQATHSGSLYAFFKANPQDNMEKWPVVVLGDEGGVAVLAKDLDDFLRFLSLDVEPYISLDYDTDKEEFSLYKEEEEEEELKLEEYIEWMATQYHLTRIATVAEAQDLIIAPAQAKYQAMLDAIIKE